MDAVALKYDVRITMQFEIYIYEGNFIICNISIALTSMKLEFMLHKILDEGKDEETQRNVN